jgi:hypothetical protein
MAQNPLPSIQSTLAQQQANLFAGASLNQQAVAARLASAQIAAGNTNLAAPASFQSAALNNQSQAAAAGLGNPGSAAASRGTAVSETCPSTTLPDLGAACNAVRNMNQCARVASSNFTGNASTGNFGILTVVIKNVCAVPIRLTFQGLDPQTNNQGQTLNLGVGQSTSMTDNQHGVQYSYRADDGTDCSVNADRPGCNNI